MTLQINACYFNASTFQSILQRFLQRLSFLLLIILYCLFIVPECSTALFTLHVHVVGSCPLLLVAGRLLVVCLLVATGNIDLFPSYYSAPSYEPLSSSSCVWRVLLLHPLLTDSWCLVALFDLLLRRRSHLLRAASCVYWYLDSLLPT